MKLAEALQERADLNRNIEQLKDRLIHNALVQEGEQPVENPEKLKQELDVSISRLSYLIAHINETNCKTFVEGKSLTELIAQKDALSVKIYTYKDIVYAGSQSSYLSLIHISPDGIDGLRTNIKGCPEGRSSFGSGFPIGASSIPVGTRLSPGKSSVLYLCGADGSRNCSTP